MHGEGWLWDLVDNYKTLGEEVGHSPGGVRKGLTSRAHKLASGVQAEPDILNSYCPNLLLSSPLIYYSNLLSFKLYGNGFSLSISM